MPSYPQNRKAANLPAWPLLGQGTGKRGQPASGLAGLQSTTRVHENLFVALDRTLKAHSLNQINHVPYELVGRIGGVCEDGSLAQSGRFL